jgi:hypothetical protein
VHFHRLMQILFDAVNRTTDCLLHPFSCGCVEADVKAISLNRIAARFEAEVK